MMTPFRAARDLLATAPGIGQLAAAGVICEIGAGVREFFPDAAHLASWTGLCPGNHESAGKHRSGRRRHGNEHLQSLLVECAWSDRNSSPTPRTWPPGPGYAPATTNPPGNTAPAGAATATSTCSPSWSNAPGQQSATTATSNPSTTGTS